MSEPDRQRVCVELGSRSYEILVGPGVRASLRELSESAGSQIVVIADSDVARLHDSSLSAVVPEGYVRLTVTPGETSKSLASLSALYGQLARLRIERSATILAFGGGMVGDLAGLVAGTWQRGVRFIQVPTTLLAAVDASVGGKTAVNLPEGKNLVGVFHQPAAVIVDTDFLSTLTEREFVSGLAESVKHAALRDPDLLAWQAQHVQGIRARDGGTLTRLIARNCAIKADVVAQDEREAGLRAILNYGHTLGHALEQRLEYELRHGECVALGMRVENEIACARGLLPRSEAEAISAVLDQFGLPRTLPRPIPADELLATSRQDKKVAAGKLRFALVAGLGRPALVDDVADEEIRAALRVIDPSAA